MARPCPSCGRDNDPGARFCSACGTVLGSACPRCGADLPADARFCPACGQRIAEAAAAPAAAPEHGERKLVTALFADIVGSTTLAEGRDPERTRAILASYFSAMSASLQSWGGTVEKYIGDAIVALFGVPVAREDDAARALQAALEMVDRLAELNDQLERTHGIRLQVRIGVNTGEVMAAGDATAAHGIVAGDAVNVAARLQQSAEPDGILVGGRTQQLAGPGFTWGESVELPVKGRSAPVLAWPLLGANERAIQARSSFSSRLVARETELAILGRLLDDVADTQQPRVAVVVGPPGIGKSRTVREFLSLAAAERPDLRILVGRCPAVGQGIAYWALGEVVRQVAGISLDDPSPIATAKLRDHVAWVGAGSSLGADDLESLTAALATTTGVALPGNPLDDLRPAAVAAELAREWPRYIDALARLQPTVILIEDVHWATDQLLQMLDRIASRATTAVLIVATARPDFLDRKATLGAEQPAVLALRPLTVAQTRSLVGSLLATDTPPDDVVTVIVERSDGNPFFVEEMLRALIDDGGLVRDEDGWRSRRRIDLASMPDTIHGVLAARIDTLDPADKRVLQEAAVIGRVFWAAPVALGAPGVDVEAALDRLERRGLVLVRPTSSLSGHVEYAFKHALVRDVAYGGLARSRRARAHASIGGWLEELAGGRHDELAELIAVHFAAAVEPEGIDLAWPDDGERAEVVARAVRALIAGGEAARKRNAIARAIEFHERAVDLASDPAVRATAVEQLADDHGDLYHGDVAMPLWEEALEFHRGRGGGPEARAAIARIAVNAGTMATLRWGGFRVPVDPARIDALIAEGLANADDEESRAWLQAVFALASSRWTAAQREDPISYEERRAAAEAAIAYAERSGIATLEALASQTLVTLALNERDGPAAIAAAERQLAAALRIDSLRDRTVTMFGGAHVLFDAGGRRDPSVSFLEQVYREVQDLAAHDILHATWGQLWTRLVLGRWREMDPFIAEHVAQFEREDDAACPYVRSGLAIAAIVLAHRGGTEEPRRLLAAIPTVPDSPFVGMVEALQGMALLALGDAAAARAVVEPIAVLDRTPTSDEPSLEAIAYIETLIALSEEERLAGYLPIATGRRYSIALLEPTIRRAEGWLADRRGDRATAERLLREAVEGFERLAAVFEVARSQEMLGRVVGGEEGGRLAAAALATYELLGVVAAADRVRGAVAGGS